MREFYYPRLDGKPSSKPLQLMVVNHGLGFRPRRAFVCARIGDDSPWLRLSAGQARTLGTLLEQAADEADAIVQYGQTPGQGATS
jgi:hypothetical protein